jgi:hypothetical protein
VATSMVDRPGVIRHADKPASVGEPERLTAAGHGAADLTAAAGVINPRSTSV